MVAETENEGPGQGNALGATRSGGSANADARRVITVVLMDPEPRVRNLLRRVLSSAGVDVVGEIASVEEGPAVVAAAQPDVIVADALMWTQTAASVEELVRHSPRSRVLVRSACTDLRSIVAAIATGANGHVLKQADGEVVVEAVRNVAQRGGAVCPDTAAELIEHLRNSPREESGTRSATEVRSILTQRELEIFRRLPRGESNVGIARELSLAENTVKNHVASILAKLELRNRVQAAVEAVRCGLGCVGGSVAAVALVERSEALSGLLEALSG